MLHVGDLDHDALVLGGFVYGALHLEVSWLVHLEALEVCFVVTWKRIDGWRCYIDDLET